jgi:ABC-2 type transport system ATP-binding protein
VILNAARVQFAGDLDAFVRGHRLLVGPRAESEQIARVHGVIHCAHTNRETSLIVKLNGDDVDPWWDVRELALEEIVLAYLGRGGDDGETAQ